ncbi:MAG TPA: DinB family protein [Herpetosiphonaceae bacterium]
MTLPWAHAVWQQYGAAIDTLADVITRCPDHLWTYAVWEDSDDARYGQFWFVAYHTLSWLDLFLTGSPDRFVLPPPFIRGQLPDQPYTKDQILTYLGACRQRCKATLLAMTEEQAQRRCVFDWMEPSYGELQLYGMRHTQEHAAHLSLVLGHQQVPGLDWIAQARDDNAGMPHEI